MTIAVESDVPYPCLPPPDAQFEFSGVHDSACAPTVKDVPVSIASLQAYNQRLTVGMNILFCTDSACRFILSSPGAVTSGGSA